MRRNEPWIQSVADVGNIGVCATQRQSNEGDATDLQDTYDARKEKKEAIAWRERQWSCIPLPSHCRDRPKQDGRNEQREASANERKHQRLARKARHALLQGNRAGQRLGHSALFVAAKRNQLRSIHFVIEKRTNLTPAF